jgi:hypothetical protein
VVERTRNYDSRPDQTRVFGKKLTAERREEVWHPFAVPLKHNSRTFESIDRARFALLRQVGQICWISKIANIVGEISASLRRRKFEHACKTTASRASARYQDETVGDHRTVPQRIPELFACAGATEFFEAAG